MRALKTAHAVATALLVAVLALVVTSCTKVLSLDGFVDAEASLCAELVRCYGKAGFPKCTSFVGTRMEKSTDAKRESWLQHFADNQCLADCKSARRCLDEPPVCLGVGGECSVREQCCGFTKGLGECSELTNECCTPHGVACKTDAQCCKAGDACDERTHTCGGVVCKQQGEPCSSGFECCTQICDPSGVCSVETCLPDGYQCASDAECCNLACDPLTKSCGINACLSDGSPCVFEKDCCSGQCSQAIDAQSYCGPPPECLPNGGFCDDPSQCCSTYCDTTFGQCNDVPMCLPDGKLCSFDGECCSQTCNPNGACGGIVDCQPGICEHDLCTIGCALAKDCACATQKCPDPQCIADVCNADPFCCETQWDAVCVDNDVPTLCGMTCAVANQ